MHKDYHLTQAGLDELQTELNSLIGSRGEIAEKLKTAREHGDLKENAEYHAARDEQASLEARIAEIEGIMRSVDVLKPSNTSNIELGNTVVLKGAKGEQTYAIVGSVEANPMEGKLSNESPIGVALMGKAVGDSVDIELPAGVMTYKIKTIT